MIEIVSGALFLSRGWDVSLDVFPKNITVACISSTPLPLPPYGCTQPLYNTLTCIPIYVWRISHAKMALI